jgi:uncharacterized membrane protein
MNGATNVKDITTQFNKKDIEDNKTMAILAYLSILVIIPILMARGSKYAMFHANQGLVLAIAEVVVGVVISFLSWIPLVGIIASLVGGLIGLASLVLMIFGIMSVLNGRAKKLPIVGEITIIK